ncbi:MAG: hypothetical protein M1499_08795 [Firmicutes bacterium]|nr:hypothetical protein [Bacillota bacterium]
MIARFDGNALRWETLEGTRWKVLDAVRSLADASRRQACTAARKHGHTVSAATWEAAEYLLILTTLPERRGPKFWHSIASAGQWSAPSSAGKACAISTAYAPLTRNWSKLLS